LRFETTEVKIIGWLWVEGQIKEGN